MKCRIAGNLVDTDEINVIGINGKIFMGFLVDCHVTIKLNNGEIINFDSVPSFEHASNQMSEIIKFLESNNLANFAVLGGKYVVNIDNARKISWKSNMLGVNVVDVLCKNRHVYTLYEGGDEIYAEKLAREYIEKEERYLNAQAEKQKE